MKQIAIVSTITLGTLLLNSVQAEAQSTLLDLASVKQVEVEGLVQRTFNFDLSRAKNLARQAAERANGGLSQYRAEPAMHGPSADAPYVDNGDGTWTFTFRGGVPGSPDYTTESVVTVDGSNWGVAIDYNGPIR
jgi:hypothetical protein